MSTSYRYQLAQVADGVSLAYIDQGEGDVIVMLPGWSQAAVQWKHQIDELSTGHRVIAVDHRGHGESAVAAGGYRVSRLGADLRAFLEALDLRDVTLMGHSMGCSVIWAYLDSYGTDRVSRLVLVDQAPMVTGKPGWGGEERLRYGCLFPEVSALGGFCEAVAASPTAEATAEVIRGMFTADFPAAELAWVAEQNVKLPREEAVHLLFDHCLTDWRDVITGIRLPSLVVGSEASIFSAESQRWVAAQNPNASVEIFPAAEGGSHFMYLENPGRFNKHLRDFVAG